ncbi:hypothetical protein DFH11DRAFT_1246332 [Phellopilus nigrolimitatus]|nr:hypothetical protein DFH11DRAFT_1246332 [Phellopilus nigrolimitatus]
MSLAHFVSWLMSSRVIWCLIVARPPFFCLHDKVCVAVRKSVDFASVLIIFLHAGCQIYLISCRDHHRGTRCIKS